MSDTVISVENLSKCYKVFNSHKTRILHYIFPKKHSPSDEVWALRDVNFEIKRGEAVAIIGRNGGGKSTLLQILTGTLTPTTGVVKVRGRVSALLELGSGFNPEYTGRDNVLLNGLLLGLSKTEILNRFEEIEAFAEIGSAIDRPVKTYSSGMLMRLAFAVQVLCDPEILIVDEALGVGDFFFQQKCLSLIKALRAKGVTLLFVSHDMGTVRDLCPRVIYQAQGRLAFDGDSSEGIQMFFREASAEAGKSATEDSPEETAVLSLLQELHKERITALYEKNAIWIGQSRKDNGKLLAVSILNDRGQSELSFEIGEKLVIQVVFIPDARFINHISIVMTDKFGAVITTTGSLPQKITPHKRNSDIQVFELDMLLMIEAGQYGLQVYLVYETEINRGQVLDETRVIGPVNVHWDYDKRTAPFLGKVGLPVSASFKKVEQE